MREYWVRLEVVTLALAGAYVLAVGLDSIGAGVPLVRPIVATVLFGALPGVVLLTVAGIEPRDGRRWVLYSVGVSVVVLMAVGLILNLSLPVVGYGRPLSAGPLSVPYLLGLGAYGAWGVFTRNHSWLRIPVPTRLDDLQVVQLVALHLPLVSVLAVAALNVEKTRLPIIAVLVGLSVFPMLVATRAIGTKDLSVLTWGLSLALLWHKSTWAEFAYDGHASVVSIFEGGFWPLGGETLLVNAVLMPSLSQLLGVGILAGVKVVMPLFVSLIPLALFVTFERYTGPRAAFLGVSLFVFAHPFYYQYPSTPRASFPVFFLALIGTLIADPLTGRTHRQGLALLFAAGLVVSHYGTSYYVLFAIVGTVGLLAVVRAIDLWRGAGDPQDSPERAGGQRGVAAVRRSVRGSSGLRLFSWSYSLFYLFSVLSWYLFVDEGAKFVALAQRIVDAYVSLFVEGGGRGSTAVRLATDYGSQSIALSKYLYVSISLLVGAGLAISVLRWFLRGTSPFDEQYLAMSLLMFALFGVTFAVSGAWGGGRPLMIVLSFCSIYPVIALIRSADALHWIASRVGELAGTDRLPDRGFRTGAALAFAALLTVFFLLNAGVMAAVAFGGDAPSNVPAADPDVRYQETDIRTHVWLADHREDRYEIYGDRLARAQTTDWMNGEIAARSDRQPYRFTKSNLFDALNDSDVESGYVLLLGHNIHQDRVEVSFIASRPIGAYDLSLDERNRIYANRAGSVYFHSEPPEQSGAGANRTLS